MYGIWEYIRMTRSVQDFLSMYSKLGISDFGTSTEKCIVECLNPYGRNWVYVMCCSEVPGVSRGNGVHVGLGI